MNLVAPQIIQHLILYANLLFHATISGEEKIVGKTSCSLYWASCGCFIPGPPIWLFSVF